MTQSNPSAALYPTISQTIGNTPLVRLQRIPGMDNERRGNVILGKLEGNNPAGSVKDRPALSMIKHAELRGDIKPGDTLIEATSGNTGIAIAMVGAMLGYKIILVMPENQSLERRQSMAAYGAELILTSSSGGMELARDYAEQLQKEGRGKLLDQFAQGTLTFDASYMATQKDEVLIYKLDKVLLKEFKSTGSTYSGGYGGLSFRVAKGVRANV
ncbi:MAG: pyridoxal-phosphate dependent enzyme, partial [Burkholderiaceae bacterium]|nr:pyridoxal-phosphate dependent enzyme [Burkholderiaceae bacterium]